jgi:hypothetical protein
VRFQYPGGSGCYGAAYPDSTTHLYPYAHSTYPVTYANFYPYAYPHRYPYLHAYATPTDKYPPTNRYPGANLTPTTPTTNKYPSSGSAAAAPYPDASTASRARQHLSGGYANKYA